MSRLSDVESPIASGRLTTPGDRQAAARQAYRESVVDGRPLSGVELGAMFERSSWWGTSRIVEVRSEHISRNGGSSRRRSARPTSNGNSRGAGDVSQPSGWGSDGTGSSSTAPAADGRRNGTHVGGALPIGSNATGVVAAAVSGNGNGNRGALLIGNGVGNEDTADAGPLATLPTTTTKGLPAATPAVRQITTIAVLAVALVAGVASYDHQRVLAHVAGEGWRAYLLPLSVDGLIVAASMTMLACRRAGEPAGALAWCALLLGLAASLAANVIAADPGLVDPVLVSRVVAAWPPVALGLSFELAVRQLRPNPNDAPRRSS